MDTNKTPNDPFLPEDFADVDPNLDVVTTIPWQINGGAPPVVIDYSIRQERKS